jgi:TPR repeat protein
MSEAARLYRLAADQGNSSAQASLGGLYMFGKGVSKDFGQALRCFRSAADQDVPMAQYYVGVFYRNGVGVPKDESEAVNWYRRAALQGFANAQFDLAGMLWKGLGVPKDAVEAYAWCNIAGVKGDNRARELRDLFEGFMSPNQVQQAQERTKELLKEISNGPVNSKKLRETIDFENSLMRSKKGA